MDRSDVEWSGVMRNGAERSGAKQATFFPPNASSLDTFEPWWNASEMTLGEEKKAVRSIRAPLAHSFARSLAGGKMRPYERTTCAVLVVRSMIDKTEL